MIRENYTCHWFMHLFSPFSCLSPLFNVLYGFLIHLTQYIALEEGDYYFYVLSGC